jgi:lipoprotein-anchoring transpeptidase ErfK/SrfK
MKKLIALPFCIILLLLPLKIEAHPHEQTILKTLDDSISFELSIEDEVGGATVAVGDLGDDGISEIVVGNGMGSEPRVHVLRQDGSEIGSFLAYAQTLGVGVNIELCDLTGNGFNEIVVAPQRGGGPHIRIFNNYGEPIDNGGFFAYDANFRGGVHLACGDLEGDERAELVTLPAQSGGPHVRIWSHENNTTINTKSFFAFEKESNTGLIGTVHDKKLFIAEYFSSTPRIKTVVIHSSVETENETQISIDALGANNLFIHNDDLYIATASNELLVNVTTDSTQSLETNTGALSAATDGTNIYYTSGRTAFTEHDAAKRIVVDTTEQRLYAFENGVLRNSFLISSGLNNATPHGNHVILAKIPEVHYAWFYGSGSPNNYDLGWIPYNLRFYPHIYIHYAPWHNNFGHKMSHGCVNVSLEDMMWIYDWAEEGIDVIVQE